ncbi:MULTISPECIES: hypothetical protein [unclassified Streptomyces]
MRWGRSEADHSISGFKRVHDMTPIAYRRARRSHGGRTERHSARADRA